MILVLVRRAALAALLFVVSFPVYAGDLDQFFAAHNPKATMTVDHSAWDKILSTYIFASPDGVNRFAYGRVSAGDKAALKAYLNAMQAVKVTALR